MFTRVSAPRVYTHAHAHAHTETFISPPEETAEQFYCYTLYFRLKIYHRLTRACLYICARTRGHESFSRPYIMLYIYICMNKHNKLRRIKVHVYAWQMKKKRKEKKKWEKRNERKAKATTAKRITALTVTTQAERVNQINRCPDIQGGKRGGLRRKGI